MYSQVQLVSTERAKQWQPFGLREESGMLHTCMLCRLSFRTIARLEYAHSNYLEAQTILCPVIYMYAGCQLQIKLC